MFVFFIQPFSNPTRHWFCSEDQRDERQTVAERGKEGFGRTRMEVDEEEARLHLQRTSDPEWRRRSTVFVLGFPNKTTREVCVCVAIFYSSRKKLPRKTTATLRFTFIGYRTVAFGTFLRQNLWHSLNVLRSTSRFIPRFFLELYSNAKLLNRNRK